MSLYGVHKLCYSVHHDPKLVQECRDDPEAALDRFDLEPAERQALLDGDVAWLYHLGAHGFLLHHLARHRLFGLDEQVYRQRLSALGEQADS
jgi:hypothetical protein